ncbi:hypothetical protein T265_16283, partial [Opisthorchis viverrini]
MYVSRHLRISLMCKYVHSVHPCQHRYSEELAMILLHWHGYNVSNAVDDLPNYVPISSKWTKSEVRKFLKCIDSKPRKDFVEAKKT